MRIIIKSFKNYFFLVLQLKYKKESQYKVTLIEDDSNYLNEIKKLEEVIIQIKETQNPNNLQITDSTLIATASSVNKGKVNKFLDDIFTRIDVIFKKN